MKAHPIVELSNLKQRQLDKRSNDTRESVDSRFNSFYARQRRLEQRIAELELALSTIRRDVNRIDRKLYRQKDAPSNIDDLVGVRDADYRGTYYFGGTAAV